MSNHTQNRQSRQLIFLGLLLFLLGLITGLIVPFFKNPRMGLSAHLEGVMNGMFLILLGLLWNKLLLGTKLLTLSFRLALYGTFANLVAIILAAATGEGKMLPIAGGKEGTGVTEILITGLLVTLALSMIAVCVLVLIGFYKHMKREEKV
ncbi:MAG: hydrogenase [Lacibacter sp.]|jgi:hydroxylaminobenzene mutase